MIVDLTLPVSQRLPSFPGSPPPQFLRWSDLERDGYNLELLFMSTHSGTHIDAPYHFARDGMAVDRIPARRLMGNAILIRIPKTADGEISRSDIVGFERKNGRIPDHGTVVFHTGWQKNLRRKDYFARNPGLSRDAASYLASKRANMVGTDSPSIDPGRDRRFTAHRILSRNGVLIVENLSNLERIRCTEFSLVVMPLKLAGASGSPVRAVGTYSSR